MGWHEKESKIGDLWKGELSFERQDLVASGAEETEKWGSVREGRAAKEVISTVKQAGSKRRKAGQVLSECLAKKMRTVSESLESNCPGQVLRLFDIRIHVCECKKVLGVDMQGVLGRKHLSDLGLNREWWWQGKWRRWFNV